MEAWVVDVEKTVPDSVAEAEGPKWTAQSIYLVPPRMKSLGAGSYKPHTVSLGPYHHGDPELLPMEAHKLRALRHVVRRSGWTVTKFMAAVQEVAEELEGAYADLGDEWRGAAGNRSRFLQVMLADGCFLLEVMRVEAAKEPEQHGDYAPNDPVFSPHGMEHIVPRVRLDMVVIENQLPLLLLQKIMAVENVNHPSNNDEVNRMVLKFMSAMLPPRPAGIGPARHPLDVFRQSFLSGLQDQNQMTSTSEDNVWYIIPSAFELNQARIKFKADNTISPLCISFQHGVLTLPRFFLDDSSEFMFLNMMAFEQLHSGTRNHVMELVQFMGSIILSAQDVKLLCSQGIIQHMLHEDEAVVRMFKRLTTEFLLVRSSAIGRVYKQVYMHINSRVNWRIIYWRTELISTYFNTPWQTITLLVGTLLLMLGIVQTVYTVLPFYNKNN